MNTIFRFSFALGGINLFSHHCVNTYSLSAILTAHIVRVDGSDKKISDCPVSVENNQFRYTEE